MNKTEKIRRTYAKELRAAFNIRSDRVVAAFASVPREHFLGPGPWTILSPSSAGLRPTEENDAGKLYSDVAAAIDASRNLYNGSPGTPAVWLDALNLSEGDHVFHLGCGVGYYTAVIAETVGPGGRVTAIEIEPDLA